MNILKLSFLMSVYFEFILLVLYICLSNCYFCLTLHLSDIQSLRLSTPFITFTTLPITDLLLNEGHKYSSNAHAYRSRVSSILCCSIFIRTQSQTSFRWSWRRRLWIEKESFEWYWRCVLSNIFIRNLVLTSHFLSTILSLCISISFLTWERERSFFLSNLRNKN